jgi:hypothetical protein
MWAQAAAVRFLGPRTWMTTWMATADRTADPLSYLLAAFCLFALSTIRRHPLHALVVAVIILAGLSYTPPPAPATAPHPATAPGPGAFTFVPGHAPTGATTRSQSRRKRRMTASAP